MLARVFFRNILHAKLSRQKNLKSYSKEHEILLPSHRLKDNRQLLIACTFLFQLKVLNGKLIWKFIKSFYKF